MGLFFVCLFVLFCFSFVCLFVVCLFFVCFLPWDSLEFTYCVSEHFDHDELVSCVLSLSVNQHFHPTENSNIQTAVQFSSVP